MKTNLEKLSKEFLEFVGENLSEVLADYILMTWFIACLLYTSPSPRDRQRSRMPSSA